MNNFTKIDVLEKNHNHLAFVTIIKEVFSCNVLGLHKQEKHMR